MDVMKAATHVSKEAMRLGIVAGYYFYFMIYYKLLLINYYSKSPISVAAAGIYMVSQLTTNTKRTQKG